MVLQRWTEWGVELDVWCCKDGLNGVLSWMCGVAKTDRMRNERIRGRAKVGEISKWRKEG